LADEPEELPPDLDDYAEMDPRALALAGWSEEELYWEELSATALSLLGRENPAEHWQEAARVAAEIFAAEDARRATSLANLALAEPARAAALLAEAQAIWAASGTWVASLKLERRARSAIYHMRLMRRYPGGYDHWSRDRYLALHAEGGQALAARAAGTLTLADPYRAWRDRRPYGFTDGRRLHDAVRLIAPDRLGETPGEARG
jgi:hypothetical protein